MPGLLLAVAGDVLIQGPSRALAWRLLHDPELLAAPSRVRRWFPAGAPFDRDPLALLLGGGATMLAALYLAACLARAGTRLRVALVALSVALIVLFPTALHISVGGVTGRPFGQDGGVVQLPLALERLASGQSPHGGDYGDSMLGKQSRASSFWREYGGNPILRHHAYLPGTHLAMLPAFAVSRAAGVRFDPRAVTLLGMLLATLLAQSLFESPERKLSAAALVAFNPLVYWHQAFGANDVVFVALLLASAQRLSRGRRGAAGVFLGLACATKQLAWPYAPFLLIQASGAGSLRELLGRHALERLRAIAASALAAFLIVVLPVIALDPHAFFADIVAYNLGIGADRYPFGGTPGFGFANFVIVAGGVRSLRDPFPLTVSLVLLAPLVLLLARAQLRRNDAGSAFAAGSVALLAAIYFSRVPHPNYLIAVAILLPLAALFGAIRADGALVPCGLLALSAMLVDRTPFRLVWEDALRSGWPRVPLSSDPLGLAFAAVASGLALGYASAAVLGASSRVRLALAAAALTLLIVAPTLQVARIGDRSHTVRAVERTLAPTPAAREPWSPSFRLEPAAAPEAAHSLAASLASRLVAAAGGGPLVSLLALGVVVVAAARITARPLASLAIVMAQPSVALASIFGSSVLVWLSALLVAVSAARRDLGRLRGLAACLGPLLVLDQWLAGARDPGPGVGLLNVASYAGLESAPLLHLLLALGSLGVLGVALTLLVALVFAPSASPFGLCAPLALLLLAVSPTSYESAATPA